MAYDDPRLTAMPVLSLIALAAIAVAIALYEKGAGVVRDAAVLSAVYLVVGGILSPIENYCVGAHYSRHADIYRPFSGFTPRYMLLHPLLLGCLCAAAWALLGFEGSAVKLS
eukprot:gene730-32717_t